MKAARDFIEGKLSIEEYGKELSAIWCIQDAIYYLQRQQPIDQQAVLILERCLHVGKGATYGQDS